MLNMLVGVLPAERMHVGHRLTGFSERGDKIDVQFENGARISVDALSGLTASTQLCSASYLAQRPHASRAVTPIVGWCTPKSSGTSISSRLCCK